VPATSFHTQLQPRPPVRPQTRFAGLWGIFVFLWLAQIGVAEPDELVLGKAEGYPRGERGTMFAERFKVGSFSASDQILPTREVSRGGAVSALPKGDEVPIRYRFKRAECTLDDYLEHQRVTGLLVLKDGRIVTERYRYNRGAEDRFLSFSMAKSVNALLIGCALERRSIKSLDDPASRYVAELEGSEYGRTTIRQLLRMSSGVKFAEDYERPTSESAKLFAAEAGRSAETPLQVLASFRERTAPAGEKFAYCSSESAVLGYVLSRATGKKIVALTSEWLWQPLGAEHDAAWNLAADGQEQADGRFNAALRDYGRLGLLLAHDGAANGQQIIPKDYLLAATDPAQQPRAFQPTVATPYFGYGYQFWLLPFQTRTFALIGIYGQFILVQPASGIVIVQTAVNRRPTDPDFAAERAAFWRGALESLGGSIAPFAPAKP